MKRMNKINEQFKREISRIILQDMSDPRLQFVSITKVDVSKDLRNANVFFSVLGESSQIEEAQKALFSAKGRIKAIIGKEINLRYTPELTFRYDEAMQYSERIEQTLREIRDEHIKNDKDNSGQ